MSKIIRIGTRNSELALWQAHLVQNQLETLGYKTQIVELSSVGDEILDIPLHQIGAMGVFTKTLDVAMLRGEIDIAVHSLKDVPTQLPETIVQAAVLERANVKDIVVYKGDKEAMYSNGTIATGSLRRTAQWLHKFPNTTMSDLRGNVNTRLQKLQDNDWNGAIFAAAGLERINLLPENHEVLDFMVPAPAQGAIMITALESDAEVLEACAKLHHTDTALRVQIERDFMRALEGGCTAPIGGYAEVKGTEVIFTGRLNSIDGKEQLEVSKSATITNAENLGVIAAEEILAQGGKELMAEIKKVVNK